MESLNVNMPEIVIYCQKCEKEGKEEHLEIIYDDCTEWFIGVCKTCGSRVS